LDNLGPPFADREPALLGKYPSGPFEDYRAFSISGRLFYDCPMHVYPVRDFPELKIAVPDRTPEYARLSPELILSGLRALPDVRLLRRLSVFDHPHPEEPWLRQQRGDPLFRIQGEAYWDEDSQSWARIRLYQPTASDPLASILAHEWSHLLWFAFPDVAEHFSYAHVLERFVSPWNVAGHDLSSFGSTGAWDPESPSEIWATLGETLLSTTPLLSPAMAYANPIRSSLFSIALARRMSTLPTSLQSSEHAFYLAVLRFISGDNKCRALERLNHLRGAENPKISSSAARVLSFTRTFDEQLGTMDL
jgi:hypothetical protein